MINNPCVYYIITSIFLTFLQDYTKTEYEIVQQMIANPDMYNQIAEEADPVLAGLFVYVLSDVSAYATSPAYSCQAWLNDNEKGTVSTTSLLLVNI